jgi:hypothetical protein
MYECLFVVSVLIDIRGVTMAILQGFASLDLTLTVEAIFFLHKALVHLS